jgi:hypothetical protein
MVTHCLAAQWTMAERVSVTGHRRKYLDQTDRILRGGWRKVDSEVHNLYFMENIIGVTKCKTCWKERVIEILLG